MKKYVVGLCFNSAMDSIVLIRKNRPKWQRGLLNGVGGHIEDGEAAITAMVREFREETGVVTGNADWLHVLTLYFEYAQVAFFTCKNDFAHNYARTTTDEQIVRKPIHDLSGVIDNIPAILTLCAHRINDREGALPTVRDSALVGGGKKYSRYTCPKSDTWFASALVEPLE